MITINTFLAALLTMIFLLFIPIQSFANTSRATFEVSVTVINPCKIGSKNGQKYLYDCVKKTGIQNKHNVN